jgi:hypothetical protein
MPPKTRFFVEQHAIRHEENPAGRHRDTNRKQKNLDRIECSSGFGELGVGGEAEDGRGESECTGFSGMGDSRWVDGSR